MFVSLSLILLVVMVIGFRQKIAPDLVTRVFLIGWVSFLAIEVVLGILADPAQPEVGAPKPLIWSVTVIPFWMFYFLTFRLYRLLFGHDFSRGLALTNFSFLATGNLFILIARFAGGATKSPAIDVDYGGSFDVWSALGQAGLLAVLISLIVFLVLIGQGVKLRTKRKTRRSHD